MRPFSDSGMIFEGSGETYAAAVALEFTRELMAQDGGAQLAPLVSRFEEMSGEFNIEASTAELGGEHLELAVSDANDADFIRGALKLAASQHQDPIVRGLTAGMLDEYANYNELGLTPSDHAQEASEATPSATEPTSPYEEH